MKGVCLPGNKEAKLTEWPDPKIGKKEVLIKIKSSAICRSDMSIYYGQPLIGDKKPGEVIPGHEPAGLVKEVGENVEYIREGDRVAISCFIGCGHCKYCIRGEPNLCKDVKLLGFHRHGGDAEYLATPEDTCLRLPDKMSYIAGSVSTDVVGNLYNTMKELGVIPGTSVGIVGLGPMGLGGVINAVAMGAEVFAFDLERNRLKKAEELGAHHCINPKESDPVEAVMNLTEGKGVTNCVDCSASQAGIATALDIVGTLGKVAQIGETPKAIINPSEQLIRKKVTYFGSWYFRMDEWGEITNFIVNKIGNDKVESIVSHRYPLEEESVKEAFELFDARKTQKVVFLP